MTFDQHVGCNEPHMTGFRLVIFDCDGVPVDSSSLERTARDADVDTEAKSHNHRHA